LAILRAGKHAKTATNAKNRKNLDVLIGQTSFLINAFFGEHGDPPSHPHIGSENSLTSFLKKWFV
jgi:hypothetical protein